MLDEDAAGLAGRIFGFESVKHNIASLRTKSAPSDDRVLAEILAKLPREAVEALSGSFVARFLGQGDGLLSNWRDVNVTLLEKTNVVTSVASLRPISILSVLHKLYLKCPFNGHASLRDFVLPEGFCCIPQTLLDPRRNTHNTSGYREE